MRARIVAWCLALLALPAWGQGAETPAKFTSYRDIETAYHSQTAELNELRTRLASLEQEVIYSSAPEASYIEGDYVPGGCSDCCEPCQECCCPPAAVFYAGVEAVWLKPHFHSADAYVRSPILNGDNLNFVPFDYSFEISPRVWLGYKAASGTGARVRYWQWDHLAASAAAVAPPGEMVWADAQFIGFDPEAIPGSSVASSHALDLETIDLEMTRDLTVGVSIIRFAAGIRYLDMGQKYNAYTFGTGPLPIGMLQYTQDFEGIGPTFGLELGHDLGCSFSFYAMARGSVLFGNRSDQLTTGTLGFATVPAFQANAIRSKADEMITIGEIGMGFEANFGGIFARAGYEGQIWFDTGTPNYGSGNMGLHGFNITTGVMF